MSGGGGTTKVKNEAGPLQKLQVEYAKQIAPYILQQVMAGFTGQPTAGQVRGADMAQNMMRKNAGTMGIQPGDPRLMDMFRMISESLTKPNPDVMSTALSLYTGAPSVGGSQSSSTSPGAMDWMTGAGGLAGTGMNIALMAKLLPTLLGGGGAAAAGGAGMAAPLASFIGAGQGLSAGLPLLASDKRLKKNITLIDNVNGVNIYSFEFLPGRKLPEGKQVGVVAQEIIEKHPEAVTKMKDGYYGVVYSNLPAEVRDKIVSLSK
jgi:hypothetical protein